MDKAVLFSQRPELRRYAMRHRVYVLDHIAAAAAQVGRAECARYYRREALAAKLGLRWMRAGGLLSGDRSISKAEATARSAVADLPRPSIG